MSAYMMTDEKLSLIAGAIKVRIEKDMSWMEHQLPILTATMKANQLGLLLRVQNEKALTARYGDKFTAEERPNIVASPYPQSLEKSISLLQEYKYQISEGAYLEDKVYLEIKEMEYLMLKEYFRLNRGV